MRLGETATFSKYIKRNDNNVVLEDVELPYELVKIDEIPLDEPLTGIVVGKRNMTKSIHFDFGGHYHHDFQKSSEQIPVYLIAVRMDGFYRVPVDWLDKEESA